MASSHGQKVTTDPETLQNPKNENPGVVTSDSLAGESIQQGGSFAANSDARGPIGQPSYSTTTNTTDVSNATRLDPAPDAEARLASSEWSEAEQLNAGSKLGKESGVGPTYNASVSSSTNQGDNFAPKGKNLQEGGFDSSAPNASFNSDVGGKKDPGRVALGQFEQENVPVAGGAGPRQSQIDGESSFDKLGGDASA
ncbi:hypothetical protein M409DRAFT_20286 [Zasmidium cellare ATCC 36951]|uniref:Uncharacterized protein n=1 Tax=Zasmidium cellare ATCC 36951 TaxID=1080233 RepID=A0A6A6CVN6_ZASCE|nr:uncharacterized protein M409DRAFT_20286 [Zasmidium cellare ATCC 36951]KAF2169872.1 hypothetical protein M409DRAFT_20286 [Zasmidium cellare ATCC 36951]